MTTAEATEVEVYCEGTKKNGEACGQFLGMKSKHGDGWWAPKCHRCKSMLKTFHQRIDTLPARHVAKA